MRQSDRPAAGAVVAAGGAAVADASSATASVADGAAVVDRALVQLRGAVDTLAAAAGVPERSGATSTTDWLRTTTGRSGRRAARTDRLARTMQDTPELAERLASGDVGPDQADRIARGLDRGTLDPADAADLLQHATHLPPGPFDREARRLEGRRHQRRLREQELAAHDARCGSRWRDEHDRLRLAFQLPPADGDLVDKALSAFVRPDPAEVPDDERRTHRQLLADALVDMARTVLERGPAGRGGGVRPHVSVLVGPEMLAPLAAAERAGATAVTDLDTVLSAAATRQLLCDATFRRVVVDPRGQVLDVGRATRTWSGPIRTAIVALDGGDRTPGSELPPDRCEIHHVRFWEQGGDTSVDNGVLLSRRGHDMVHVEGWDLRLDPTTRVCTWTSPDGATTVRTHPRGAAARGPGAPHDIPALRDAPSTRVRPPPRGDPPDEPGPATAAPLSLEL